MELSRLATGHLLSAADPEKSRYLMKDYAQAAQAHDITRPFFGLKYSVDEGICLTDVKLESALFFEFNGRACVTTSGVFLERDQDTIKEVAFMHEVQIRSNGPESVFTEAFNHQLLSVRQLSQRPRVSSFPAMRTQPMLTEMPAACAPAASTSSQACDTASMESFSSRSSSPAFSADTPLHQHTCPQAMPEKVEARRVTVPGAQPGRPSRHSSFDHGLDEGARITARVFLKKSHTEAAKPQLPSVRQLYCRTKASSFAAMSTQAVLTEMPAPCAPPASTRSQACDTASMESFGSRSSSSAFSADAPLPQHTRPGPGKSEARQVAVPGAQPGRASRRQRRRDRKGRS